MTSNLTEEQTEIFQFARTGHNLLITGQTGTGKSWVVNTTREDCKQRGRKVALVCSSGIAVKFMSVSSLQRLTPTMVLVLQTCLLKTL